MLKLPVGVDQPGLPEAMGEIKVTLPRSTRYALCSERLIITHLSEAIAVPAHTTAASAINNWKAFFTLPPQPYILSIRNLYSALLGKDSAQIGERQGKSNGPEFRRRPVGAGDSTPCAGAGS